MSTYEAQAVPIRLSDFGTSAIVESFEGLSPGPNIPQEPVDTGFFKPGVNGPFTFPSGVKLTGPIPNVSFNGVSVGDFAIGPAPFSLAKMGLSIRLMMYRMRART